MRTRTTQDGALPSRRKSSPPLPDPCLVSVKTSWGATASEKAYREARNCPHGCGRVCKGMG